MVNYSDAALHLEQVYVRRGRQDVLQGVDLTVSRGSLVGLLGPSGSGKTTLMRTIVGAQAKVRGTVSVLGEPAGSARLRTRIGYMTQAPSVYDDLTVKQNLGYFRAIVGAPAGDVARVIDETELTANADRLVDSLSGGERSRVSLAVAMLGSPELLVLDEPTVGLDPVLRVELWDVFRRLVDAGKTIIVSSHVMDEATRCDELILMRDGRVLVHDTLERVLTATGADDAENAFLTLVDKEAAA